MRPAGGDMGLDFAEHRTVRLGGDRAAAGEPVGEVGVRQVHHGLQRIHLGSGQRNRWWIDPNIDPTMLLHQRPCVPWIGFPMQDA